MQMLDSTGSSTFSRSLPGFAAGGFVGPTQAHRWRRPHAAACRRQQLVCDHRERGPGRDAKQNQDAADRTAKAIEQQIRAVVGDEIIKQMRPGNAIYQAARGRR